MLNTRWETNSDLRAFKMWLALPALREAGAERPHFSKETVGVVEARLESIKPVFNIHIECVSHTAGVPPASAGASLSWRKGLMGELQVTAAVKISPP